MGFGDTRQNVMVVRGDVQVRDQPDTGVHFDQYDPQEHDVTRRHDYVANA